MKFIQKIKKIDKKIDLEKYEKMFDKKNPIKLIFCLSSVGKKQSAGFVAEGKKVRAGLTAESGRTAYQANNVSRTGARACL